MKSIFRVSLLRRFFTSVREEGAGTAMRKARIYLGMRLRGITPSILGGTKTGDVRADHTYMAGMWQTLAQRDAFHIETPPAYLSKRRKIALIGDLNLPQCRKYRVEQLAEFWEAQGVSVEYAHYQDVPRCTAILQSATHLMEYRLQTSAVTAMYRYEARRLRLPVLYDLDDPLFSVSAYETYRNMQAVEPELKEHFVSEAPKYLEMMNGADIITVSTPGLAKHARLLSPRQVHVRRNFADRATLALGAAVKSTVKAQDGNFRVCFASGSRGHEADFALISDQLVKFLASDDSHRLMILGHFDKKHLPATLQDRVETYRFSTYDKYLGVLARANVALMPLTDDVFNHCKSAVRVIDASSVGVPSLVGPIGDMDNVVDHGRTGLIVQDSHEWGGALAALAADKAATAAMGEAARWDVETRWSGQPSSRIIDPEILEWIKD